jgi:hypothetical protein
MTASERLRELDKTFDRLEEIVSDTRIIGGTDALAAANLLHNERKRYRDALPEIIAVVEAAERTIDPSVTPGWGERELGAAIYALNKKLAS